VAGESACGRDSNVGEVTVLTRGVVLNGWSSVVKCSVTNGLGSKTDERDWIGD
jgi:hypothetical protein